MGADENNRFVLDGESLRPRFVFIPLYHPFITIRIAQSTMEAMRCLRGAGRRSISLINGNFGKGGEKKFGESGIICWSGKKSIFIRSRGRIFSSDIFLEPLESTQVSGRVNLWLVLLAHFLSRSPRVHLRTLRNTLRDSQPSRTRETRGEKEQFERLKKKRISTKIGSFVEN